MKKRIDMKRIMASTLCLLLCALCLTGNAFAAGFEQVKDGDCTLRLIYEIDKKPAQNVQFQVYRVADVLPNVTYEIAEAYKAYNVWNTDADWLERASALSGYVRRDKLPADGSAVTDEQGRLQFEPLPRGLYLVLGANYDRGDYTYTPVPFLISLPNTADGNTWEPDVETYVKYTQTSNSSDVTRRVIKVWDDDEFEDLRPEQVTVDLLRDGEVVETAVLSGENNWRHTWSGLDASSAWQVVEQEMENYAVSVTENGATFVITNTYSEENIDIIDPDPPLDEKPDLPDDEDLEDTDPPLADGPKLPQTGQLWWPVPLLCLGGTFCMTAGWTRRRRWSGEDAE